MAEQKQTVDVRSTLWRWLTGRTDPIQREQFFTVKPDLAEEIVRGYLPQYLTSAESVRTHAQAGYTVAGAVLTAIIAAGITSGVAGAGWPVQAAALAAMLPWLLSAYFFMRAAAKHPAGYPKLATLFDKPAPEAAKRLYQDARFVRKQIVDSAYAAQRLAALGMTVTVVALIFAFIYLSVHNDDQPGSIALSRSGQAQLEALCSRPSPAQVEGTLDPGKLNDAVIKVKLAPGQCPSAGQDMPTVQLRKAAIDGFRGS